jgi:hypothetical protein
MHCRSIIPYPPGRLHPDMFPRHFMPGYHRTVPPGQKFISGTKVTFGEVGAHRLSKRSHLLALVPWHFVSVLPRKEFMSCSS